VPHHETPFDNIDSALEYVSFLVEACREAEKQVAEEIARMALQLVSYKLDRLTSHVGSSERLLKDLRRLRRLILEERHLAAKSAIA
jgi:hypothetical protein